MFFKEDGWVDAEIVHRDAIALQQAIEGPAVIEEQDSTVLVLGGQQARMHESGALIVTLAAPRRDQEQRSRSWSDLVSDQVWLKILHAQLVNVCEEMASAMMRTSYSPIFSEGLDFSTMILDPKGDLVAMVDMNPAMLGQSLFSGRWVIDELGARASRRAMS